MNKYVLSLTFLFFSVMLFAQSEKTSPESFVITSKTGTEEAEKAVKAVAESDMDTYRLRSVHRILKFDNGVVIELLSALELKSMGYQINLENYTENLPANYIEPVYSIGANGSLIERHISIKTK